MTGVVAVFAMHVAEMVIDDVCHGSDECARRSHLIEVNFARAVAVQAKRVADAMTVGILAIRYGNARL